MRGGKRNKSIFDSPESSIFSSDQIQIKEPAFRREKTNLLFSGPLNEVLYESIKQVA